MTLVKNNKHALYSEYSIHIYISLCVCVTSGAVWAGEGGCSAHTKATPVQSVVQAADTFVIPVGDIVGPPLAPPSPSLPPTLSRSVLCMSLGRQGFIASVAFTSCRCRCRCLMSSTLAAGAAAPEQEEQLEQEPVAGLDWAGLGWAVALMMECDIVAF